MSQSVKSRGDYWFSLLTQNAVPQKTPCQSIRVTDGQIGQYPTRFIAVVPDPKNLYPRARNGEVGLLEGWSLDQVICDIIEIDRNKPDKRAIVAIIDVSSQAYGRREEAFGIHQSLAGAVAAYATARQTGHPIIGLIVGKAMSGAFLAHGYQANRLIALNDPGVMIHAMGKEAAARITLRTVESLDKLTKTIPPMAYDIQSFNTLGLLEQLIDIHDPLNASAEELKQAQQAILQAIDKTKQQGTDLSNRLHAKNRQSSLLIREQMRKEW